MQSETVVHFPTPTEAPAKPSNFDAIWGKKVKALGYAAIPSILIRSQHRLGVNTTQFCILVHLLEYLRFPDRQPFPTKQQLADRIGIKASSIKTNMRALEQAGLIRREQWKTPAGDWGANTYHLDGLIEKIKSLEPEFAEERRKREIQRKTLETPRGKRGGAA